MLAHKTGIAVAFAQLVSRTSASYGFYVGKDLSASGYTLLGGTGEEVSSHWLQIFPAANHEPGSTITGGVTPDATLPGNLINITQVPHTYRYMSMEYSDYEGFPAPLTNGGVNEYGVGVRDIWATNRDELYYMTPDPQTGLQYSDLARLVLERCTTAREGVQLIGDLITEYGYATYGGNSHLIADKDEGWVVWEFAGGEKLWAAERLGPDVVRVSYPGYIEDFPLDYQTNDTDYMGSPNLVSFAVEQGWWNRNGSEPFNIFKVYGVQGANYTARDGGFKYMSQAALENLAMSYAPVTETDMMRLVRDPRIADDEAGYGQVVSLRPVSHPNNSSSSYNTLSSLNATSKDAIDSSLLLLWTAPTGSVTAPFNPWYLGVTSILPEYAEHRYLTKDAASTFLDRDYQYQEATIFAGRVFKRLLYYTCSDPNKLLPTVTAMLEGIESQSNLAIDGWVDGAAKALLDEGKRKEMEGLLTYFSTTRAEEALRVGRSMVEGLDSYVKVTGQYRSPVGSQINDPGLGAETVNCLIGHDPDQPAWDQEPQVAMA